MTNRSSEISTRTEAATTSEPVCWCGHVESAHDAGECWTAPENHAHPDPRCWCDWYEPVQQDGGEAA
ncbi:hypothetical protein [Saccharopolyspora taberi]|uniref:Uncharacterized protein n=1 Tax=Saccharopolyspora taberi TaxID=60895 RepID=A0ABN3V094_9PSEU